MKLTFSIDEYDADGERIAECISCHFDNIVSIHFKNLDELKDAAKQLNKIIVEIERAWLPINL